MSELFFNVFKLENFEQYNEGTPFEYFAIGGVDTVRYKDEQYTFKVLNTLVSEIILKDYFIEKVFIQYNDRIFILEFKCTSDEDILTKCYEITDFEYKMTYKIKE